MLTAKPAIININKTINQLIGLEIISKLMGIYSTFLTLRATILPPLAQKP